MNDVKKTLKRARLRVRLLTLGSFLSVTLPPAILFLLRWEVYTDIPAGGVRLAAGGVAVASLFLLALLGKLRLPSGLTLTAVALVLVYLLEGVLPELALILWVMLGGMAVETLLFSPLLRRAREQRAILSQTNETAGAVETLLRQYVKGESK